MKRKMISMVVVAAVVMITMSGCGGLGNASATGAKVTQDTASKDTESKQSASEASSEVDTSKATTVIKVSNGASESSPGVQAQISTFKKLVEEKSGGKIKVEIYSGGQLGDDTKGTEACRAGQLEMVNTSTAPLVGLVPELAIFDIPFLFNNNEMADKVVEGEIGDYINAKLEAKGLINLAWNENGFRDLTNSVKVVQSPADLKGLKIRTMENKYHLEAWKLMGASPTPMSWSEVFTALQQETIDGQENPIPNFYSTRIQEVNKYITITHHIYSPFLLLSSKEIFDKYDEETQNIIREAAQAYGLAEKELNRAETETKKKALVEEGCTVTDLTNEERQAFKEITAPVWDSVEKAVGSEIIEKLKAAIEAAR
ncbi:MAG: transporter substrate-binding protein [Clostridia bacterium]|jgi:tripartite ATP-independent transporter DctP family solute receptor|nr:transporter substrate-binding protein [Clostridia bacterium]